MVELSSHIEARMYSGRKYVSNLPSSVCPFKNAGVSPQSTGSCVRKNESSCSAEITFLAMLLAVLPTSAEEELPLLFSTTALTIVPILSSHRCLSVATQRFLIALFVLPEEKVQRSQITLVNLSKSSLSVGS
jgi:hypothetical protein